MEDKVTIGSLGAGMSRATGKSKKLSEDFLREFFRLASEVLESGEQLRIKGFGTFKIVEVEARIGVNVNSGEKQEIEAYKKVSFAPAKELAAAINSPFEEFESIELDDDFSEDLLNYSDEEDPEENDAEDENVADTEVPEEPDEESTEGISDENNVSDERLEVGSEEEGSDDLITYEAYTEPEPDSTP